MNESRNNRSHYDCRWSSSLIDFNEMVESSGSVWHCRGRRMGWWWWWGGGGQGLFAQLNNFDMKRKVIVKINSSGGQRGRARTVGLVIIDRKWGHHLWFNRFDLNPLISYKNRRGVAGWIKRHSTRLHLTRPLGKPATRLYLLAGVKRVQRAGHLKMLNSAGAVR